MKPSITNTDAVWEWFGRNQPYFGVLIEAKYRNEQLTEEAKKDFFSTGKAHVDLVFQTIKEHFDTNFTIKRALDFGCGVGRLTIPLSAVCKQVVGVDASPSMLREAAKNAKEAGAETIEFLLADDNLSTLGSLHFTYSTPPPDCAFTLKSKHGFAWYLRYRSYVVNGIMNLVEGNSFDRPLPIMQMNEYNLSTIHKLLYENECGEVYTRFTDHAGALGVLLFFRKRSIAPL